MADQARETAEKMAMKTLVAELAMNAGITEERFVEALDERRRFFLDQLFQDSGEDGFTAKMDDREIDEIPTNEGYTPLFPE